MTEGVVVAVHQALVGTGNLSGDDLGVLDPSERARADAFRSPADARRYVVAHAMLRRVLGAELRVDPTAVRLRRAACSACGGPHGRPVVHAGPPDLHFSLSHAGDVVLVAVAARPVGVDVEQVATDSTVRDVSRLLHPLERDEIAAASAAGDAFTRLWTRKEAYLKALGTGLSRDLALDYVGTEGRAALPAGWVFADVPVQAGHVATLAVRGALGETVVNVDPPRGVTTAPR